MEAKTRKVIPYAIIITLLIVFTIVVHVKLGDARREAGAERSERLYTAMLLYEQLGRVNEIRAINSSCENIPPDIQNQLIAELEDILSSIEHDRLLRHLGITITTSDIGDICEELISQIEYNINSIFDLVKGA